MRRWRYLVGAALLASAMQSYAKEVVVPMVLADGQETSIGTIKAEKRYGGVLFSPDLHDLPKGVHGMHIHANPTCADHAKAAGSHLDPAKTDKHEGPYVDSGHLGDLPVLVVGDDGRATTPVLAPRLTLSQLEGHSIIIHAGGDNYADVPAKLGGGGDRIACGVVAT